MEKVISVYKYKDDKTKGIIRTLLDNVDYESYVKRHRDRGISVIKINRPSFKMLEKWSCDSIVKAVDGCKVEPDGICKHGYPSFLLVMNII